MSCEGEHGCTDTVVFSVLTLIEKEGAWLTKVLPYRTYVIMVEVHSPLPFIERSDPEIPIVLITNQMPSQIEQVTNNSMCINEPLSNRRLVRESMAFVRGHPPILSMMLC